jgi:type VI secretion system secreted protein VgrG
MSTDVFSIHCDALEGAKLAGFKGIEALNRPFELDVFFTVPVGTDVKTAIGARATLTADRADDRGPMCWHGVFAKLRLLHETAERALYRAALVPKLWLLRHYVRNYVHTKKKADTFLADTLKDAGLAASDFQFHIDGGAYPQEDFVCQYRESHLDFIHRWLEREGLYYYFEHPDGAGATEKMVIVDDKAHHHPLFGKGKVRYCPSAGHDTSAGECLRELSADFDLLPASVMISDYNYANPSAPLSGEKAVSGAGQGLIREYGYRVFNEGEAGRLAGVKAQSMGCRELVLTATGDTLGLRAGYTFEVEDAPADLPAKYLALEVRHAGAVSGASSLVKRYTGLDAAETYRVDVVAIPSSVQYRAPQATAWPRIYGFENGTVDGPGESQYAQIDDQGRYLVRFKFDASDLPDGSTSTYLRMMQPHGGTTEGWHFPLRKGTEVMVSFHGGDPDRPVIAGVVPNAVQPSNVTSKNHTQNVLKTGGGNFMVMDDQEGSESIDMFSPVGSTSVQMGGPFVPTTAPTHWKMDFPPMTADGPSTPIDTEFTLFFGTEGNAGVVVNGSWIQNVGASYCLDVGCDMITHCGLVRVLRVDGKSTEYHNAGFAQTITGDGEQHVFANWRHYVSAKNFGHYGEWKIDVDNDWGAKAEGDINVTSNGGTITIKGPKVIIDAPSIEFVGTQFVRKSSGWDKGHSSASGETYTSKVIVGGHKSDYVAALYTCGYGLKIETTAYSAGLFGVKGETANIKNLTFGAVFSQIGTDINNAVSSIENSAFSITSSGLHIKK